MGEMKIINKRKVKCPGCGKEFIRKEDNEGNKNFVILSKRHYHIECAQEREKDILSRQGIFDLLEEKWGKENVNYGLVSKQIKNFEEQNGFTISGILGTVVYLFNHQRKIKMNVPKYGIAMVAYKYQEASDYFKRKKEIDAYEEKEIKEIKIEISPQKSKRLERVFDIDEELF